MKHFILEMHTEDQENEGVESGLILNGLVDDTEQEQAFVSALIAVTILAGVLLVGVGLYLSIFWGV
ncbi:hypothetical protein [Dyadobacter soli]|nr:hypothetical protein [Dyadobacter soli]